MVCESHSGRVGRRGSGEGQTVVRSHLVPLCGAHYVLCYAYGLLTVMGDPHTHLPFMPWVPWITDFWAWNVQSICWVNVHVCFVIRTRGTQWRGLKPRLFSSDTARKGSRTGDTLHDSFPACNFARKGLEKLGPDSLHSSSVRSMHPLARHFPGLRKDV